MSEGKSWPEAGRGRVTGEEPRASILVSKEEIQRGEGVRKKILGAMSASAEGF